MVCEKHAHPHRKETMAMRLLVQRYGRVVAWEVEAPSPKRIVLPVWPETKVP